MPAYSIFKFFPMCTNCTQETPRCTCQIECIVITSASHYNEHIMIGWLVCKECFLRKKDALFPAVKTMSPAL